MISIRQRMVWFLLPIVLSVGFMIWLYVTSPQTYVIYRRYSPSPSVVGSSTLDGKAVDAVELWNAIIDEMPGGSAFINSKVREISRNKKIVEAWISDPNNRQAEQLARRVGGIGRYIVSDIKDRFTIKQVVHPQIDHPDMIEFFYQGTNLQLGTELVNYYSQDLPTTWKKELNRKLRQEQNLLSRLEAMIDTGGDEDEDDDEGPNVTGKRVEIDSQLKQKIEERQFKIDGYRLKLTFLTNTVSPITVKAMGRNVSNSLAVQGLFCLIGLGVITVFLLVGIEFFGKTFTTELQVSQYLDIRLIGTMRKIDSV
jgi:hypothetical protein